MKYLQSETIEVDGYNFDIVYFHNPETRNSFSIELSLEFEEFLDQYQSKTEYPRALVLSGKGAAFSAGGDFKLIKALAHGEIQNPEEELYKFYGRFLRVRELPFPVLGAINGHAVGAGLCLALACDLRIFSLESRYSFNFTKIGIHPGMGATYLILELVGTSLATQLLFLSEYFTGKSAWERGLCHYAVPTESVFKRTMEICLSIAENSPIALRYLKKSIYNNDALKLALKKEAEFQVKCFQSRDILESISAIEQKRKPRYRDE